MIARSLDALVVVALAAMSALGAGCEDPSLRVVVQRPEAYASLVERIEISVYERDGLTCDDIAYDKLSAEELRAILRSSGSSDLDAIPRLGHKAVVARGYRPSPRAEPGGAADQLVIAGCTEVDEIGEQERVEILTEPVATAAIDASVLLVGKGAVEIAVVAIDARQEGIDGKEVRFTTYGPSGSFPASGDLDEPAAPTVLRGGEGSIRPTPPAMVGPYAVQVRIKWSTGLPPLVAAMMVEQPLQRSLGQPDLTFVNACTIYTRGGVPTLACLEKDSVAARFVRSYRLGAGGLTPSEPQVSAPTAIGVFGVGEGVIVLNLDGTYAGILGSTASGTACEGGCTPGLIADAVGFAGCGAGAPGLFTHYREGTTARLVATSINTGEKIGFGLSDPALNLTLGSVGCVTDLETGGAPRLAATLATASRSLIYLPGYPVPIERLRDRRQGGTGFTTSGGEARLLTTELDPTGFIVSESVLNRPLVTYRLFERRRSPAVAAPRHYVSGQFDLDEEADIAWDVLDDAETGTRAIQMLLAARPGRPTLIGRMPLPDTADLLTADLDGDGVSELIGYTNSSVSIQRLGALR